MIHKNVIPDSEFEKMTARLWRYRSGMPLGVKAPWIKPVEQIIKDNYIINRFDW